MTWGKFVIIPAHDLLDKDTILCYLIKLTLTTPFYKGIHLIQQN